MPQEKEKHKRKIAKTRSLKKRRKQTSAQYKSLQHGTHFQTYERIRRKEYTNQSSLRSPPKRVQITEEHYFFSHLTDIGPIGDLIFSEEDNKSFENFFSKIWRHIQKAVLERYRQIHTTRFDPKTCQGTSPIYYHDIYPKILHAGGKSQRPLQIPILEPGNPI